MTPLHVEPRVFRPGAGPSLAPFLSVRHLPHRLDPADYCGYRAYSLTICAHSRTRPFTDAAIVRDVLLQFLRTAVDFRCEILAYCVLPDHVHLIVIVHAKETDLREFVRLAKQRSGYAYAQASGSRLWQQSYFDRTVRTMEELPSLVEYIIGNPVRAGLAGSPADYPYWGSERYTRDELLEFVVATHRSRSPRV